MPDRGLRRVLSIQHSAVPVAADQVQRATINRDHATQTVERLRTLATKGSL